MAEECMNPVCNRVGVVDLTVFGKLVGRACQFCCAQRVAATDDYRIALRPDEEGADPFSADLDDIVVKDVTMFRAEAMERNRWWVCCYLAGSDERIAWSVVAKSNPLRIEWVVTEVPDVGYEHLLETRSHT